METNDSYDKKRAGSMSQARDPEDALKKFRQPLFDYLVSGLEAEDKWVRVMAAGMLGTLGDPGAAGYLKALAVDHDADLREISKKSLMMLYPHSSISGAGLADPCDGCMIRFIAEEALACQKNSVLAMHRFPDKDR
jgi:HEAT repeat protein